MFSTSPLPANKILLGDCCGLMSQLPEASIDLIVTDPPYLVNYRSRDGRSIANDVSANWLRSTFAEAYRVLKPDSFCVSFYGWQRVDRFMEAWRNAGFTPIAHLVWHKEAGIRRRAP